MKKETIVPVLMYHSIGIPNEKWIYNHLTCPYNIFESQLMWLKKKQFHTISLQQLYSHMSEGRKLPKNPVVLTFDDGYLDNWVFAYPLLKKYGFSGTIYLSPEFVDPAISNRKNLDDFWKTNINLKKLKTTGFLSWEELIEMEKEGVMDIQSHAMSHTLYFKNNKIINFRHPKDPYNWITWNQNPDKKPFLQLDDDKLIQYGEPVYEYDKSLGTKRFFPDKNLSEHLISYVKKQGMEKFFKIKDWKKILFKIAKTYKKKNKLNERFETEVEYEKRIRYELEKSKEIIENKLNKDVEFLCWPGGGISNKALEIALDTGYISSTVASDMTDDDREKIKNKNQENPLRINRMGTTFYWNKIAGYDNKIIYKKGFLLILSLYDYQGRKISGIVNKSIFLGTKVLLDVFYG